MATISGRLGLTGTVGISGSNLVWNIPSVQSTPFVFGTSNSIPIIGDWNGDGIEGIGHATFSYTTYLFQLRQTPLDSSTTIISFGSSGDIPISWYVPSIAADRIGIKRGTQFHLDDNWDGNNTEIITSDMTCYFPTIAQCIYNCPTPSSTITII